MFHKPLAIIVSHYKNWESVLSKFVVKNDTDMVNILSNLNAARITDWQEFPMSDLTHAICHFAADYHSGQASRGYKLLCRAIRRANRQGCMRPLDVPMSETAYEIYAELEEKYTNKI